jgi:uncharacterized protein
VRKLLRERLGIVIAVLVVLVFLSATRVATFLTDLWWFDALGYREIFTGILLTQIGLGAGFGLALALLIAVNLWIARRLKPIIVPASEREAVVERYRQMADPYVPWIIVGVALLFALSAGGAVAAQWDRFLLWINGGEFGWTDPSFGRDASFYVFDLPWLSFVQGWLFTALLLTLIVTAGAHYLLGSIRPEVPGDKVTAQAKVHLSVLLALVLGAHAWGYWLDRFHLNFSPRGTVTGMAYTDVNAELPALNLLLGVSVLAIILVFFNIRKRGWVLPGAAIGLLILASIILQGIYPAAIQRLQVDPQELAREHPYIERNMAATRFAYGLDEVERSRFDVRDDFSDEDIEEHRVTLENVRLWRPEILDTTYQQLQALRRYYEFSPVSVDRYAFGGDPRQVMIAVRELRPQGLDEASRTWQNIHLTYTQGHGAVASQVNLATRQGQPVFLARDIPPRHGSEDAAVLIPDNPAVYFGRTHDMYSIVRTDNPELAYEDPDTNEEVRTQYDGIGDVAMGNMARRATFALRFADPNIILSNLINHESGIIFRRTVQERVEAVAPYLTLDEDPYPVVLDRRIVWIQDAYTKSAHFPYSERRSFGDETVNYVRNSVKAVVDAYDGTVDLYVAEPDDPIIQAWQEIFPAPFRAMDEAPEQLEAHFRYPQDIFKLQADVYRTYHIPTVEAFYTKADEWDIPPDAAAIEDGAPTGTLLDPYYLLMRLPGEADEEFVLIQPYLARDRPNMIAWLAGRSDPGHHGDLFNVRFPTETILGTTQAQARIEQDPTISEYITLRDRAGSDVIRGDLMVIPIERSILYVEPLFIQNPQAVIPELAQVVVVMGDDVVMQPTLEEALEVLVGIADPVDPLAIDPAVEDEDFDPDEDEPREPETEPADPVDPTDVDALVIRALELLDEANAALARGDLAAYQQAIEEAYALLDEWAQERGIEEEPPPDDGDDADDEDDGGTDAARPAHAAT